MCLSSYNLTNNFRLLGAGIFFGRGVPNLQKVSVNKTAPPPHFGSKNFMTPHHWYTLPPNQAKIVFKISVFLNKINTPSVVILWLLTFRSSKFYDPPIFLSKKLWSQVYLGPPSKENASPLYHIHDIQHVFSSFSSSSSSSSFSSSSLWGHYLGCFVAIKVVYVL